MALGIGIAVAGALLGAAPARAETPGVHALQTDGLSSPLGIDSRSPELSWQIEADGERATQTAYEVRAASSPNLLAADAPDLWDSGRVESPESRWVSYGGDPLRSRERVYWQVRVWTSRGVSGWSAPAWFEMGLLDRADWSAKWIEYPDWTPTVDRNGSVSSTPTSTPFPVFKQTFTVASVARAARLYITGLGMYDVTINGRPVSDAVLEPGQTDYDTEVQYRAYDVTGLLRSGANAIEIATGGGIYGQQGCVPVLCGGSASVIADRYWCLFCSNQGRTGPPRVIAQLETTGRDGARTVLGTGEDWKTALGPTTYSGWYGGEDYDAARAAALDQLDGEPTGQVWKNATPSALTDTTTPRVTTPLVANPRPPVKVVDRLKPIKITQPVPGTYVFDFGKNFSGWPELHLDTVASGIKVVMLPGERLKDDGTVDQSTMTVAGSICNGSVPNCEHHADGSGGLSIRDEYTSSGAADQVWHPRFTYHGFRYLQVSGLSAAPTEDTITALKLRAANVRASSFTSSSPLLNRIDWIIRNAVDANMESVITDCPDREKGPYTGDAMQDIANLLNAYDMRAYLRATVRNFADAQHADGMVPATGPEWVAGDDGTNWGGAMVMIPWALYQTYGDVATLRTYYGNMQKYLAYVHTKAANNLLPDGYGLGDWVTPDGDPGGFGGAATTPIGLFNTASWYVQLQTMAKIARLVGHADDAPSYERLADDVASAFNARYLDRAKHTYSVGTQSADAIPLDAGLVPDDQHQAVLDHLLATIEGAGGLIKVGSPTLAPILHLLHTTGHDDVIARWAESTEYPSYGYIIGLGHTTMTESWPGVGNSLDHHFLGGIDAWFTYALAGIQQQPGSIGYSDPVIKPSIVGDLSTVTASYRSPYGELTSGWRLDGTPDAPTGFELAVTVPGASPAKVAVPLLGASRRIVEDGRLVWDRDRALDGIRAHVEDGYIVFDDVTGSHSYAWRY